MMGMWGFGWRMHRRRGLRGWVLSMLASAPKNGAEIMDEIEAMSQGWWRPSPGSVYPLLDDMASEGLVSKRADGKYELSEKGRQAMDSWFMPPFGGLSRRVHSIEEMLNEMSGFVSYIEDLNRSDKSKVAPYLERMRSLSQRLDQLSK